MANDILIATGSQIVWGSEVGDDKALTSESVASAAGRRGAIHDWGAAPRASLFRVEVWTQFQATPTLGLALQTYIYQAGSETATPDHPETGGTTDAAVSALTDLRNAELANVVTVRTAAADTEFAKSSIAVAVSRHWGVAIWNASGATTTADESETKVRVTPLKDQVQ